MNSITCDDLLAEVRSLFADTSQTPKKIWPQLCQMVDCVDDLEQFHHEVLHYIEDHIWQWPASIRKCPSRWTLAFLNHPQDPRILLAPHHLCIHGASIDDDNLRLLMDHWQDYPPYAISLRSCALEPEQLNATMEQIPLDDLTSLDLHHTPFDHHTLDYLAQQSYTHQLEHLDLGWGWPTTFNDQKDFPAQDYAINERQPLDAFSLANFLRHDFSELKSLNLYNLGLGDGVLHALNGAEMPKLHSLNIGCNDIEQWSELQWRGLTLNTLCLGRHNQMQPHSGIDHLGPDNRLVDMDMEHLLEHCGHELETLHADFVGITDFTMDVLCTHPALAQLKHLNLAQNRLNEGVTISLCHTPFQLTSLNLAFCELYDWSFDEYLLSSSASQLAYLDLSGNEVNRATLQALLDSPYLTNLRHVHLRYIGEEVEWLQTQHAHPRFGILVFDATSPYYEDILE